MSPETEEYFGLGSVTVYLGMSKSELLKKVSEKSYKTFDSSESTVEVVNAGHVYTVRFSGGKLVYADSNWPENPELIDAILGGLGSIAKGPTNTCSVLHQPLSDPDVSGDRFFIECGQRNLLIGKLRIGGNVGPSVLESIGDPSAD